MNPGDRIQIHTDGRFPEYDGDTFTVILDSPATFPLRRLVVRDDNGSTTEVLLHPAEIKAVAA